MHAALCHASATHRFTARQSILLECDRGTAPVNVAPLLKARTRSCSCVLLRSFFRLLDFCHEAAV